MSVLDQIKKLDEQKAALLAQAKTEALDAANKAIASLNELGFNYRLVQGEGTAPAPRATGTRRTGIRDQLFDLIKNGDGMARADIIEALGARGDKSAEQSISNALAALKKAGTIKAENGVYSA